MSDKRGCAYRVVDPSDRYATRPHPCSRKAVRGDYCGQHAKKVERLNELNARFGQAPFDAKHAAFLAAASPTSEASE